MDRRTFRTKNPGHCGEVAVSGGLTIFATQRSKTTMSRLNIHDYNKIMQPRSQGLSSSRPLGAGR